MAREQKINPCRSKGRYAGSRGTGRMYSFEDSKESSSPAGCECAGWMFCNAGKSSKTLVYGIVKTPMGEGEGGIAVRAEYAATLKQNGLIPISPCEGGFLNPDSPGTIAYKKAQTSKTKFLVAMMSKNFLVTRGSLFTNPEKALVQIETSQKTLQIMNQMMIVYSLHELERESWLLINASAIHF